jgi:hypothetical protein
MVFDTSATEHGNETNANFIITLQCLTTHIFPFVLWLSKNDTCAATSFSCTSRQTQRYLLDCPPFDVNQDLNNTGIMDILENGVPNTWSKNMVLQGYNSLESTASDFVAFCEQHEFTEGT